MGFFNTCYLDTDCKRYQYCSAGDCVYGRRTTYDLSDNYTKWYWIGVLISLVVAAIISTLVYCFVIRPRRMRSAGAIRNAPLNPQANVVYMNPGQPQGYAVPAPMPTGMPGPMGPSEPQQFKSPVAPPPYSTMQQTV